MNTTKTVSLALAYIGDGYLASASTLEDYYDGIEFTPEVRNSDGYCVIQADNVPTNLADNLLRQGSSDQVFGDGYEAAQAAIPYLPAEGEYLEAPDENRQSCPNCGESYDSTEYDDCPNCEPEDDSDDEDSEPIRPWKPTFRN